LAIQLNVTPETSLVDEGVVIRITGLAAGQYVTLRAETKDGALRSWSSSATYAADASGAVDLTRQAPLSGTYSGVDGLGLLWSMTPSRPTEKTYFSKRKPAPLTINLSAGDDEKTFAEHTFHRGFKGPGVTSRHLDEDGIVGALFLPATSEPRPGVLVLNGSDGGMNEHAAALLASRGFAALALAYFGVEGVPSSLVRIPLENFGRAIKWLQDQKEVDAAQIGVIGHSRGGELALQLGATFPEIQAVVAGAPSSVRHSAMINYRPSSKDPSWTLGGDPLPFVEYRQTFTDALGFMAGWIAHRPYRQAGIFARLMNDADAVAAASIEVEKINGPVLLITGADDQLWPSALYAERVVDRLSSQDFPFPFRHLSYKEVGHFACFPYGLPSMPPMLIISPVRGLYIGFGGTAERTAQATQDAWLQIQEFLRTSLRPKASDRPPSMAARPAPSSD
jgi:dienelactone hydrolase